MSEQVNPLADLDIESELEAAFEQEIAHELLERRKIQITEAETSILLEQCKGNPWDVVIMHQLLEIAKEMKK
jgi:hypothetical protein